VRIALPVLITALAFGCSEEDPTTNLDATTSSDDAAAADASPVDSGHADAAAEDATPIDSGAVDTGVAADLGFPDSGVHADADPVDTGPPQPFDFYTPAWMDGARVPAEYTCAGAGGIRNQRNPELVWENPPAGTAAFVMIFDDPDAGGFPHWAFFTSDATVLGVPVGTSNTRSLPSGITEVSNGFGATGYGPNCPGGRLHTYRWRMWAVSTSQLGLTSRSNFGAIERAAQSNALGMVQFTGQSDARR